MVNRSKAVGTAAESAVRNYLLSCGFSALEAHRNVLKGSVDEGDVWLRHPKWGLIIFEVKAGKAAKNLSHEQAIKWVREAEAESRNANAAGGVLVTQRGGVGHARAGQWWLYTDTDFFHGLGWHPPLPNRVILRMTLAEFISIIRAPSTSTPEYWEIFIAP